MPHTCHRFWKCYKTITFCSLLTSCTIPCACQAKRHLNFQKWPGAGVFCTFSLRNALRATTACTFSTSQLPKAFRGWCVLCILTSKCASRHSGVQFFISHLARWLRTRRCSEPTFRPGATNHWKNSVSATFLPFRASASSFFWLFLFSDLLSSALLFSLTLPISAFHLSILSEVWLLNFLRIYINVDSYMCMYIYISLSLSLCVVALICSPASCCTCEWKPPTTNYIQFDARTGSACATLFQAPTARKFRLLALCRAHVSGPRSQMCQCAKAKDWQCMFLAAHDCQKWMISTDEAVTKNSMNHERRIGNIEKSLLQSCIILPSWVATVSLCGSQLPGTFDCKSLPDDRQKEQKVRIAIVLRSSVQKNWIYPVRNLAKSTQLRFLVP